MTETVPPAAFVSRSTTSPAIVRAQLLGVFIALAGTSCSMPAAGHDDPAVILERLPRGGVQPQVAISADGTVHVVYLKGAPAASDVYYTRRDRSGAWSAPVRVNSERGSAIATGTVRGAHLTLGRADRVHVTWNGSPRTGGMPFFYARSASDGRAFEPQRNVVTWASGLDGGGSVAADRDGHVYAVWHAAGPRGGEAARVAVLAISKDDGAHFAREEIVSAASGGVCACCALRAMAVEGRLWILYRAARGGTQRDIMLLSSPDGSVPFEARTLERWPSDRCPMSTASIIETGSGVVAAWEHGGRVRFQFVPVRDGGPGPVVEPPRVSNPQKHPVLARNASGEMLAVWTEGTGWNRGGSVAWQRYDREGRLLGRPGRSDGVPVWSLAAAAALPDSRFLVLY